MNPIDLKELRAKLAEYDPESPRCKKKRYVPVQVYGDYAGGHYEICCLPDNHDGPCRSARKVLGWPGYSTLLALLNAAERGQREQVYGVGSGAGDGEGSVQAVGEADGSHDDRGDSAYSHGHGAGPGEESDRLSYCGAGDDNRAPDDTGNGSGTGDGSGGENEGDRA